MKKNIHNREMCEKQSSKIIIVFLESKFEL